MKMTRNILLLSTSIFVFACSSKNVNKQPSNDFTTNNFKKITSIQRDSILRIELKKQDSSDLYMFWGVKRGMSKKQVDSVINVNSNYHICDSAFYTVNNDSYNIKDERIRITIAPHYYKDNSVLFLFVNFYADTNKVSIKEFNDYLYGKLKDEFGNQAYQYGDNVNWFKARREVIFTEMPHDHKRQFATMMISYNNIRPETHQIQCSE